MLTLTQRLLAAASLAVLICCAVLGYLYLTNEGRRATLTASLASYQASVDKINAAAEAANASDPLLHSSAFPRDPPDLALASAVLASAAGSGVSTGPIQTTTGGTEKIGNNTYRATVLNLTIAGSLSQILSFFDRMEQSGLRTIVFDNIRLEPANGEWTMQVQIIVYAQPESS